MPIFKFEAKRLIAYTFWWSAAMAASIILMLPVYISMITGGQLSLSPMGTSGFFEMLGVDANVLMKPIGVYGFLTLFLSILSGTCGMFLGLKAFTKETVGQTAEFTYTKPYRRGAVFLAKVLSALLSALIIGAFYFFGSLIGGNANGISADFTLFFLIGISFLLIELFFLLFGAFLGAIHPKIRAPLLTSAGIVFMFFCLSSFSTKVKAGALKFLTPFAYFPAADIVKTGGYNLGYLAAYCIFCILFAAIGYICFIKKDVAFIA